MHDTFKGNQRQTVGGRREATANDVIDVLADEFDVVRDGISLKLQLADLGVDSLDRLGLALRMEERFGVPIRDDSIDALRTVGDVVQLVCRAVNSPTQRT